MRRFLPVCLLLVALCSARAQDQERKLVDRILKPDTTLENDAQNKKFTADRSPVDKKADVGTFYLEKRSRTKAYSNTRDFSTEPANSRSFNAGDQANARYVSQKSVKTSKSRAVETNALATNSVYDADKKKGSRDYPGNRPFLGEGKSQKSLSQKSSPMTIEQVRELLNKNK